MGRHAKSKCIDIASELVRRIKNDPVKFSNFFPTRAEIARDFSVSDLTAYRVLSYLEETGVISCGRGRRSRLLNSEGMSFSGMTRGENIGVIYEKSHFGEAVCTPAKLIMKHLRVDGAGAMPIEIMDFPSEDLEIYSGFIVTSCVEAEPNIYERLSASGKPYAGVSFSRLMGNTICIITKHYVMEFAVYVMRGKIRRLLVIHTAGSQNEIWLEESHGMRVEECFSEYGYECETTRLVASPVDDDAQIESILEPVFSSPSGACVAIICKHYLIAVRLYNILERHGKRFGRDYVLASYCSSSDGELNFSKIDFRMSEYVEEILAILYRQLDSGTCRDVGAVHMPLFVPRFF